MSNSRFQITILGCGAAVPTLQYKPTSQVVNVQEHLFLIDCGEGTQVQLRNLRIKFQKINQIFISHLHGDHFFGLIGLLSTYHLLGRTKKLQIFGPKGLEEIIRVQLKHSGSYLSYEIEFTVLDLTEKTVIFENKVCRVYGFPLKHRIPTTGYLIEEKEGLRKLLPSRLEDFKVSIAYAQKIKEGNDVVSEDGKTISFEKLSDPPDPSRSYAFCSDTAYSPPVAEYVKGVNCLYHESTFLDVHKDRAKQTQHSTAKEAGKIASMAGVGKLVLGHFSARYTDYLDFVVEAQSEFGDVQLAEEGTVINVV